MNENKVIWFNRGMRQDKSLALNEESLKEVESLKYR